VGALTSSPRPFLLRRSRATTGRRLRACAQDANPSAAGQPPVLAAAPALARITPAMSASGHRALIEHRPRSALSTPSRSGHVPLPITLGAWSDGCALTPCSGKFSGVT